MPTSTIARTVTGAYSHHLVPLEHLDGWMKPMRVPTPLVMRPGHMRVRRDPLGVTLIIGAWNEPFMLTLAPLPLRSRAPTSR